MSTDTDLHSLLAPLQRVERLHRATLRRFGHHVVDLSYPNPQVHLDHRPYQVLAALANTVDLEHLRYSPFGGFTPTRRHVAATLTSRHDLPYVYDDVVLTAGASAAISLTLRTLFTGSDRVIVPTPCWMDYPLYLADLGIGCDLVASTATKHLDLEGIERAWTPSTRGIILSQPSSPTGVTYGRDELRALSRVLRRRGGTGPMPVLISDETHRDQVWAPAKFHSPVPLHPRSVSVYSFGKAWQMQGQRTGYVAVSPLAAEREALRQHLLGRQRASGQSPPTALMQHLVTELQDFAPDLDPLAGLQRRGRASLAEAGFDVVAAEATPFIYARAPGDDDVHFTEQAAQRGVLIMPSTVFHEPGYFRIALNTNQEDLENALKVLADLRARQAGAHV